MQFSFSYQKNKVLQGLRYHFLSRPEIKGMILIVNIFAILSAVLFYFKKIQPQPFILSSFIWVVLLIVFWFLLPWYIYKKSNTFKDHFLVTFSDAGVGLENEKGTVQWDWQKFSNYFESPAFFHLYFSTRAFFLIPKDSLDKEDLAYIRGLLNGHIASQKS